MSVRVNSRFFQVKLFFKWISIFFNLYLRVFFFLIAKSYQKFKINATKINEQKLEEEKNCKLKR